MYVYEEEKKVIFTEEGSRMFLRIRDKVKHLLKEAGAVRMKEAISGNSGSSWEMLACVDRLVELCEIREITPANTPGQWRVFISNDYHGH